LSYEVYDGEIFSAIPEYVTLYHYTTHGGLLGLLNSKSLWFSHINYQNDQKEFNWFIKLFDESVIRLYHERLTLVYKSILKTQFGDLFPVFTFSLSEKPDLLSQWRGYCPNGYCISFESAQLNSLIKNNPGLKLVKCKYLKESNELDELVKRRAPMPPEAYQRYLQTPELKNSKEMVTNPERFARHFLEFLRTAPYYKHQSFSEESEWRIIADHIDTKQEDLKLLFREGKSKIIPYLKYSLCENHEEVSLPNIIVGPNPQPTLAARAVEMLMKGRSKVKVTETPYLNW
jgi:hypothetical protein